LQTEEYLMTARILVIDDDPVICSLLTEKLRRLGYEAQAVQSLKQGLITAENGAWDVVLLDIHMPDGNGLEYIPQIVKGIHEPEVIIVTGDGAPDGAERAIHGGAWTYIEKINVIRDLPLHLMRALQYREEKQRARAVPVILKRKDIIGDSEAMQHCFEDLVKAAASDVNVLITGETGTGKEVFARAVHENSARATGNFVVVDCASLPENLIESALFGHIKGAFTGADGPRKGLIKHADNGTLFLDEVGELPPSMQKTFLRVLQERRFRPIGAEKEIGSNFRLLAATNRSLEEMVSRGLFREDLLYRLKGLSLHLPPLKERREDIKDLVIFCISRLCERYGQETKGMSSDFLEALALHEWPGNVRELFQTIEQAFARAIHAPTLFGVHLPQAFRVRMAHAGMRLREGNGDQVETDLSRQNILPWRDLKAEVEKEYVKRLLEEARGNIQTACALSGLSRARLYQLISRYDISI
jgi:two-component system, NtrC family, response regulator